MSRATAVIILVVYIAYLIFQLWSHPHLFNDNGSPESGRMKTRQIGKHSLFKEAKSVKRADAAAGRRPRNADGTTTTSLSTTTTATEGDVSGMEKGIRQVPTDATASSSSASSNLHQIPPPKHERDIATVDDVDEDEEEDEEEEPTLNLWSTVILLLVVAALVGVTAEWLVDSIDGLVASGHISEQWVGLILVAVSYLGQRPCTPSMPAAGDADDLR